MKCKMCKKETDNGKSVCDKCKNKLKKKAPAEEVEEFEKLIEEENLENTKDLTNLKDLMSSDIDDDFIDIKDSKLVTAFFILFGIIGVGLIVFLVVWFINRPKEIPTEVKPTIDYEEILAEYGTLVSSEATKYINTNKEVPTWQVLSELVKYDKYEISCQVHNIYIDGSVYLEQCKVNNKTIKYTYGELKDDAKTGKEIVIYSYNGKYVDELVDDAKEVGRFTCATLDCEFYLAFDKYAVVKEKNAKYLYNYKNNTVEFGPFDDDVLLSYNFILYGVYYEENGKGNIYNISTGKTLKGIQGTVDFDKNYVATGIEYKYGYMITYDNQYNFVNLKTGNVSFRIKDDIKSFVEDMKSNILYILVGDKSSNKFKVYNSNGKLMFNGEELTNFKVKDYGLVTFTQNGFKMYDSKLNLKLTSKSYSEILRVYDDFIVVINKKEVKLIDYDDKEIVSFETSWKDDYKIFDTSFRYNDVDKELHMTFEDTSVEEGKYIHYNYNFKTNTSTEMADDEME